MLTHTFESSTSEYHESTINSDNEKYRQKRVKKPKKAKKDRIKTAKGSNLESNKITKTQDD